MEKNIYFFIQCKDDITLSITVIIKYKLFFCIMRKIGDNNISNNLIYLDIQRGEDESLGVVIITTVEYKYNQKTWTKNHSSFTIPNKKMVRGKR